MRDCVGGRSLERDRISVIPKPETVLAPDCQGWTQSQQGLSPLISLQPGNLQGSTSVHGSTEAGTTTYLIVIT